jgi:hypothetical protein
MQVSKDVFIRWDVTQTISDTLYPVIDPIDPQVVPRRGDACQQVLR